MVEVESCSAMSVPKSSENWKPAINLWIAERRAFERGLSSLLFSDGVVWYVCICDTEDRIVSQEDGQSGTGA